MLQRANVIIKPDSDIESSSFREAGGFFDRIMIRTAIDVSIDPSLKSPEDVDHRKDYSLGLEQGSAKSKEFR